MSEGSVTERECGVFTWPACVLGKDRKYGGTRPKKCVCVRVECATERGNAGLGNGCHEKGRVCD